MTAGRLPPYRAGGAADAATGPTAGGAVALGGGSGLFAVTWGLGATGIGVVVGTDFRGAARFMQEHGNGIKNLTAIRAVGLVFAVVGPLVLVGGLIGLARGGPDTDPMPPMSTETMLVMSPFALAVLVQPWWRTGWLRTAWADGDALRRTAAVLVTAASIGFLISGALGGLAELSIFGLVGGVAGVVAITGRRPADPPADPVPDRDA